MTFEQAEKKLKRIAGKEYRAVTYSRTVYSTGEVEQECKLYTNSHGLFFGSTWAECFEILKRRMQEKVIENTGGVSDEM